VDLQLSGRRALITGGSRGIGLACARALLAEGAAVGLVARGQEALDAAAETLRAEFPGATVAVVAADSADDAQVRRAVDALVAELGGIDILINGAARVAGSAAIPRYDELTDDEMRMELEIKLLGYLRFARAVGPLMAANGWGRIINIAGLAARSAGGISTSVRNVAVAAMTKNLADELGPHGVNVTVVHPGLTVTERTPGMIQGVAAMRGLSEDDAEKALGANISIGRMITAEEVADVVTFLASPRSVSITGDAITVGGGSKGPIYY